MAPKTPVVAKVAPKTPVAPKETEKAEEPKKEPTIYDEDYVSTLKVDLLPED